MKVTRGFLVGVERYFFDWGECSSRNGWAQVDTDQDFCHYGNWANPKELKVFQYCEGDTTLWECETPQEFIRVILDMATFEVISGRKPLKIDGMCNEQIIAEFKALGLGNFLH